MNGLRWNLEKPGIANDKSQGLVPIKTLFMGLESSFPDSVTSMVPNFDTTLCEEYLDYFYEDPSWKNDTIRLTNKAWA